MQEVIEKILRDTGEFEEEDIKESAEIIDSNVRARMEFAKSDLMTKPIISRFFLKKKENRNEYRQKHKDNIVGTIWSAFNNRHLCVFFYVGYVKGVE